MFYIKYEIETGRVITVYSSSVTEEILSESEGLLTVETLDRDSLHYVKDGQVVSVKIPKYPCTFNYETKSWNEQEFLHVAKSMKKKELEAMYHKKKNSFFIYKDKKIAADVNSLTSMDSINGYINITNRLPDNWIGGWKAVDNTYVPITDVTQWVDFYTAKTQYLNACFLRYQELKDQLSLLNTVAEIENLANW